MFFKKGVLKKFHNIHRKTPVLESLFSKVAGLKACNFIKKRLQHRCFPVNIAKFLRAAIFIEHLRCLPLKILLKKLHELPFTDTLMAVFHGTICMIRFV